MLRNQASIEPDLVVCSYDVVIADEAGLRDDIPMFSKETETVYISVAQPSWKDNDGAVAENCPRNPGFDATKELGCFACGLSSISYNNGNIIYS